jgi:hypothetical protein
MESFNGIQFNAPPGSCQPCPYIVKMDAEWKYIMADEWVYQFSR